METIARLANQFDVLTGLAYCAAQYEWTRPICAEKPLAHLAKGMHPLVIICARPTRFSCATPSNIHQKNHPPSVLECISVGKFVRHISTVVEHALDTERGRNPRSFVPDDTNLGVPALRYR